MISYTVNMKIFARTLFSRNFAYAKFRENKTLAKRNGKITLYVNLAFVANFTYYITNMSFNAIRENKILAKISESTV